MKTYEELFANNKACHPNDRNDGEAQNRGSQCAIATNPPAGELSQRIGARQNGLALLVAFEIF